MSEFRDRNKAAREAALMVALAALALIGLLLLAQAVQADAVDPAPRAAWLTWLDVNLIPFIQLLGGNPVIAGLVVALLVYVLVYLPVALAVVWTFRVKYDNDRTKASFRVLVVWNLFEFSAMTPWVFSRKLAKHYWPLSYNPFDDKSGAGKIEPPKDSIKDGGG